MSRSEAAHTCLFSPFKIYANVFEFADIPCTDFHSEFFCMNSVLFCVEAVVGVVVEVVIVVVVVVALVFALPVCI